jgi:hypothetical protein
MIGRREDYQPVFGIGVRFAAIHGLNCGMRIADCGIWEMQIEFPISAILQFFNSHPQFLRYSQIPQSAFRNFRLVPGRKDHPESRFAVEHTFVSFRCLLNRIDLVHRTHPG